MIQIGFIILLTIIILRELFLFKPEKDDNSQSTEDLRKKYQKKDFLALFGFFILIPILTIGLSYFYDFVSESMFKNEDDIIYLIKPNMGTWFALGLFSSFGVSIYLIIKIMKLVLKENVNYYWIYYNRKYGFNASKLLKYLCILLILFCSTLACFQLNYYVKIKADKIEINSLLELKKKEYSIDSIDEIIQYQKTIAPNGKIYDKTYYVIKSNNEIIWRTNDNSRPAHKNDDEIFEFISKITNIEIKTLEIEEIY